MSDERLESVLAALERRAEPSVESAYANIDTESVLVVTCSMAPRDRHVWLWPADHPQDVTAVSNYLVTVDGDTDRETVRSHHPENEAVPVARFLH
jgi:hypothetical protein